jgi:hypothetical protein
MESWINAKRDFQTRFTALSTYRQNTLPGDIQFIQGNMAAYVNMAGNTYADPQDQNNVYNKARSRFDTVNGKLNDFATLNKNISDKLKNIAIQNDTGSLLTTNGQIQSDIRDLEKKNAELKADAETAMLRDELVKDRNTAVNRHQLFFLNKPLNKSSIPFLWGFSILFVGIGVLIFKQMFPIGLTVTPGTGFDLMSFITDPRVLIAITVASLIVIIFLVMKILGVFDSKNKPKVVVN